MDLKFSAPVKLAQESYPQPAGKTVKYGTAGFRLNAEGMEYIMYRMGLLAALRSCHQNAAIGLMITASHNPVCDNGIKMVDPAGDMLAAEWEEHATFLVNQLDKDLDVALSSIISRANINTDNKPVVIIGQDTRPSSKELCKAAIAGAQVLGAQVNDLGVISTPVLHFVVACHNDGGKYGEPTVSGYYKKLGNAFKKLHESTTTKGNYTPDLFYDGANGVGAMSLSDMTPSLNSILNITLCNTGEGILNNLCGADYVKTDQTWPNGVPKVLEKRCVSVDGDADRVIYSYLDKEGCFHLVDGDKIATLVAGYIQQLVKESGLDINLGLVQTAYANGASTAYIKEKMNIPISCAKTGVKHLHHAALDFDIGIYFEANGHGTVIFSNKAKETIAKAVQDSNKSAIKLSQVMDVINETVGDAISDMLLVETVLLERGWSISDWDTAYTDLPNKLCKVHIKDRSIITTTDAERKCVTPEGLQEAIDKCVSQYKQARSFVRPSGTENVVRVYAEAASKTEVDSLAIEVIRAVHDIAGGIGERP